MMPEWLRTVTETILHWHASLSDGWAFLTAIALVGFLCWVSLKFLAWLDAPARKTSTCHCCGKELPVSVVHISSDPRHQGVEMCKRCLDEKILSERWAHLPGIKWFD